MTLHPSATPAHMTITVDPQTPLGPVKPMNAVNNGPVVPPFLGDQTRGNFIDYKAARIPFARTHDSVNCVSGGAHTCDISTVFPHFDADENDPSNYDFVFTDYYLNSIRHAGTEVFFRLGQTIEHGPKKYGVLPPKDFAKWARICEHVIRHYNEGWGWGLDTARTTHNIEWHDQFRIRYWEIWNEPDLDPFDDAEKNKAPRCWGGSTEEFFTLFETAAKHLKAAFPSLKIGGPALCGNEGWADRFLGYCHDHAVPLDFLSWHFYSRTPEAIAEKAKRMRAMMDRHGYDKAESILNEWNYVKGWTNDWVYSLRVESGDLNLKDAAYTAATMCACQAVPLDLLMYYDARVGTVMNGLFDHVTLWPLKAYYPFYAWSKLADRGTAVTCSFASGTAEGSNAATGFVEKADATGRGMFYAVAAQDKNGSGALFIVRYTDDDNVSDTATVALRVSGCSLVGARCHLTDLARTHTEVPLEVAEDGSARLWMQPWSFALIEW